MNYVVSYLFWLVRNKYIKYMMTGVCTVFCTCIHIIIGEVKSPDPLMDAKLNSKTHLQTHFSFFPAVSCPLASNLCPYAEVGTSDKIPIFR